jgi:Leucine-rich repeat (LRR) protein
MGGDVTQLSGIFGGDSGVESYVDCTLGNFGACSTVIKNAITYATDTKAGFPSQLTATSQPGPSAISYGVSPYTAYAIYPMAPPELAKAVQIARGELDNIFEKTYHQIVTADRLLDSTISPQKRKTLEQAKGNINANITTLLKAADVCYNTPERCPDAVHNLHLQPVDENALLPDSFSALCKESLSGGPDNPVRATANALINLVDAGGRAQDADDCEIYGTLVSRLTSVTLSHMHLSDLTPLAGLVNIERLFIDDNQISDLSPLADMKELKALLAGDNRIQDIRPLAGASQLDTISLEGNRIRDASPLKDHLVLRLADFSNNQLSDLTPFAALPQLLYLNVKGNNISDLSPFKQELRLRCLGLQNTLVPAGQISAFVKTSPKTVVVRDKGYAVMWYQGYDYACKIP